MNIHSDFGKYYTIKNNSLMLAAGGIVFMFTANFIGQREHPIMFFGGGSCAVVGLIAYMIIASVKGD
jgi:hypothetical protein